jgi:hypothetical protein
LSGLSFWIFPDTAASERFDQSSDNLSGLSHNRFTVLTRTTMRALFVVVAEILSADIAFTNHESWGRSVVAVFVFQAFPV